MKNLNKKEKLLIQAYEKTYNFLGYNFHEIKEKNREGWFMNYFISQEQQEKILSEVLKKETREVCEFVKINYYLGCIPSSVDFEYKLERLNDGLVKQGYRVKWFDFDKMGKAMSMYDLIGIDRSLVLYDVAGQIVWQTTNVVEIIKEYITLNDNYIHFKTENSEYKLYRTIDNDKKR